MPYYQYDREGYVKVYIDGACFNNGQQGARAGLGVFWGNGHPLNSSQRVKGRPTNNSGEIQAAILAMEQALDNNIINLAIYTDSQFLIKAVTQWMPGWKENGWRLYSGAPVRNQRDFKQLDYLEGYLNIKWNYVEAHSGVHGNEMADQLAKAGAYS